MFTRYFYIMDIVKGIECLFQLFIFLNIIYLVFIVVNEFFIILDKGKKDFDTIKSFIKRRVIYISVLMFLSSFIPKENTIKAYMFDKMIIQNSKIIKDNAKELIDYSISKIKDVAKENKK